MTFLANQVSLINAIGASFKPLQYGYFDLSGRFLCDPNEINGWGLLGPHDNVNTQDIGNSNATQFLWSTGGYTRPFDYELKKLYVRCRNNNSEVQAWGFVLGHSAIVANTTAALETKMVLHEVNDNGGVGPRDYGNTTPKIIEIDLSGLADNTVQAYRRLTLGVSAPTAVATNRYVEIADGFIEYKRI